MPKDSRGGRSGEDRRVLLVGDLLRSVEDQFRIAFPRRIWVLGVVRGLQGQDPLEFLLTETAEDGGRRTLPSELGGEAWKGIDSTLRRLHDVAVDDLLVDGHLVRAGGLLSYDSERHLIVFSVTALDPEPTRAWLNDRRDSLREAAHAARMGDRQRDVRVPLAPASVGIVGTTGDGGLAQARAAVAATDFTVEVVEYAVSAVGADTSDALATAVRQACAGQHDVVLMVREGGRPLALAPFDAEQVVRAVSEAPVPVITGLGSAEEPTAVDEVAHQMCATPHDAADAVLRRLQRASDLVEQAVATLHETGDEALRRAARRVEQKRAEVGEHARRARVRAERARARRLRAVRTAAAVVALLVVVLAVLVTPWLAVLLLLPLAAALFAERLRPRRRSSPMAVDTLSFATALKRLGDIQRELDEAADPDDVERLEAQAADLADRCRALLRRPRPLRGERPAAVATGAGAVRRTVTEDRTESYRASGAGSDPSPGGEPTDREQTDPEQTQAISLPAADGDGAAPKVQQEGSSSGNDAAKAPQEVKPQETVDLRAHDTERIHDTERLHETDRGHDDEAEPGSVQLPAESSEGGTPPGDETKGTAEAAEKTAGETTVLQPRG